VRGIVAGYVVTGNPFDRSRGTQAAGALARTQGVDAREVKPLHARGWENASSVRPLFAHIGLTWQSLSLSVTIMSQGVTE
jgi:hypothetical protein